LRQCLAAGFNSSAAAADHNFNVLPDAQLYALGIMYTKLYIIQILCTIRDYDRFVVYT